MKEKIAAISILANVILAGGKIAVGIFSNSAAIMAAGLDSFADIFSSIISYAGIRISGKPADKKHPYGHYKFEALSGTIIAAVIIISGAGIIWDSFKGFFRPPELELGYQAFGIMAVSALANGIMSSLKIYYGKKENSLSLLSDGLHSRIDVYTSIAILAGLYLSRFWAYADPALAVLMGIYIIKEAFLIGREAIGSLLDVSAGEEVEGRIRSIAGERNIGIDSLKTQKKGPVITANLEIKLPSGLKVEEAARISEDLRSRLMQEIDNLRYVAIQIASYELETSYYKPPYGSGFGWQRRGKFTDEIKEARGQGPDGFCICGKCGYRAPHERGAPCSGLKCPHCGNSLRRE